MSLSLCPIQYRCEKYENSSPDRSEFVRCTHPCNEFVAVKCDMAIQLEMFLATEPIACAIDKHKTMKEVK